MPPLDHIARTGLHKKVSRVGQVSIPAPVRRRWDMERGGLVHVYDLDAAVMLVPETDHEHINNDAAPLLGRYAISSVGQMTLPAEARNRWGLKHGGRVEFVDLMHPVLYLQQGTLRQMLEEMLSIEALTQVAQEHNQRSI